MMKELEIINTINYKFCIIIYSTIFKTCIAVQYNTK